ncbi:hypothetical protein [Catenovulum agarivorans]|uniref:hypothetical protein n=1 Tax=Catenovulum agarivorans TaxID=1172192 RepID=UPI00030C4D2D|nr:hypothetical protein [Catenovulum agarivorans]
MKWLRAIVIGSIAVLCLFVTADYLFDRTNIVNQQLNNALAAMPMQVRIDKVNHRLTQLGELQLQGVHWQDKFGDSVAIDNFQLKFNWRALLNNTLDINQITIEGVRFNASTQGLRQLQHELQANASEQPEQDDVEQSDISEYLPNKLILDAFALTQVEVAFATEHQQVNLQQANVSLRKLELTQLLEFDPVNLSFELNLALDNFAFADNQQQQNVKLDQLDFALELAPKLQINHTDLSIENIAFNQPNLESSIKHIAISGGFVAQWLNDTARLELFNWQTATAKLKTDVERLELVLPQQARNNSYVVEKLELVSQMAKEQLQLENLSFNAFGGQTQLQAQSNLTLPLDLRLKQLNLTNLNLQHYLAKPAEQTENATDTVDDSQPQTGSEEQTQQIEQVANLYLEQINISNLNAQLIDPETPPLQSEQSAWFALNKFNFELTDVAAVQQHKIVDLITLNNGAKAKLAARQLSYLDSQFNQLSLNVQQQEEGLVLTDSGLSTKDGRVQTQGTVFDKRRIGENSALVNLQTDIYRFDLAALQPFIGDSAFKPTGMLDANIDADLQFKPEENWLMQQGNVQIKSGPFAVEGIAMDKLINGFKASQETSLLDVGSFLVAGPVGMMAMQFVELTAGAAQFKGQSQIKSIEANAHVQNNLIRLDKAKLKTAENNLGFIGNVNLNKQAFEKFRFAILDDKDCPTIQQTLDGKFSEVKKVLFNTTSGAVTSPLSNVWRKAKDAAGGGCKSFFAM